MFILVIICTVYLHMLLQFVPSRFVFGVKTRGWYAVFNMLLLNIPQGNNSVYMTIGSVRKWKKEGGGGGTEETIRETYGETESKDTCRIVCGEEGKSEWHRQREKWRKGEECESDSGRERDVDGGRVVEWGGSYSQILPYRTCLRFQCD